MSRAPIDANAAHAVSPARATTHQHAGRAAARRDELITISHPGLLSPRHQKDGGGVRQHMPKAEGIESSGF
jgi:hypothetical protein